MHVEIFGQTYAVQAGADPGYVEQLAAYVDAQMREVSRAAGAVDSVRVAVLAALNIADECFRLRAEAGQSRRGRRRASARPRLGRRELAAVARRVTRRKLLAAAGAARLSSAVGSPALFVMDRKP